MEFCLGPCLKACVVCADDREGGHLNRACLRRGVTGVFLKKCSDIFLGGLGAERLFESFIKIVFFG